MKVRTQVDESDEAVRVTFDCGCVARFESSTDVSIVSKCWPMHSPTCDAHSAPQCRERSIESAECLRAQMIHARDSWVREGGSVEHVRSEAR